LGIVPGEDALLHDGMIALHGLVMQRFVWDAVGSSRVDLQACKLEYSIVSPK
jgi:hypothetical protein